MVTVWLAAWPWYSRSQIGLTEVPVVSVINLSEAKLRTLRLALNRLGEDAAWDGKARYDLESCRAAQITQVPHAVLAACLAGFSGATIPPS
jgi:hypothetical protein